MRFTVRVYDPTSGTTSERALDAADGHAAERLAARDGAVILSLRQQRVPVERTTAVRFLAGRRERFDVRLFCDEVRTLLSAGMSLVEALDTLVERSTGFAGAVVASLRAALWEGKPFSSALATRPEVFPMILVAAVRASERTGTTQLALDEYVRYDAVFRELRRRLVSAAIYPTLVVCFGIAVGLFLLAYVVPRFAKVYDDFARDLSMPTRALIAVGRFMGANLLLLALLGTACIAIAWWLLRDGGFVRFVRACASRIGPLQGPLRTFQLSRIFQTMAMLTRGGYPVLEAISLARNLAFQASLRDAVDSARQSISEGKPLSTGFAEAGLTDSTSERLLRVGERTGRIDPVLDVVARRHAQELETLIERATRVVEPALMMGVGLLIGALIVLMYMPIFDLANGMQ